MFKDVTRNFFICVLIIVAGVFIKTDLHAQNQGQDIVYLKNGTIIYGDITEMNPSMEIRIQTKNGSLFVLNSDEIEKIEMKKNKKSKEKPKKAQNEFSGNVNFIFGNKELDDGDDWEPIDEHQEIGVLIDIKRADWPVSIAVNVLRSWSDETEPVYVGNPLYQNVNIEFNGKTTELNLGFRKTWDDSEYVRPFIGGGLALIKAEVEFSSYGFSVSEDDTGPGLWIDGGVYFNFMKHCNVGIHFRWSKAEVTLYDNDLEAGGIHYGVLAGFHW